MDLDLENGTASRYEGYQYIYTARQVMGLGTYRDPILKIEWHSDLGTSQSKRNIKRHRRSSTETRDQSILPVETRCRFSASTNTRVCKTGLVACGLCDRCGKAFCS